jgi:hypothetical protein
MHKNMKTSQNKSQIIPLSINPKFAVLPLIILGSVIILGLIIAIVLRLTHQTGDNRQVLSPQQKRLYEAAESFGEARAFGFYQPFLKMDWSLQRLDLSTSSADGSYQGLILGLANEYSKRIDELIEDPESSYFGMPRLIVIAQEQHKVSLELHKLRLNPKARIMRVCSAAGYCQSLQTTEDISLLVLRLFAYDHLYSLQSLDQFDLRQWLNAFLQRDAYVKSFQLDHLAENHPELTEATRQKQQEAHEKMSQEMTGAPNE